VSDNKSCWTRTWVAPTTVSPANTTVLRCCFLTAPGSPISQGRIRSIIIIRSSMSRCCMYVTFAVNVIRASMMLGMKYASIPQCSVTLEMGCFDPSWHRRTLWSRTRLNASGHHRPASVTSVTVGPVDVFPWPWMFRSTQSSFNMAAATQQCT
jgi:hypothetical protein